MIYGNKFYGYGTIDKELVIETELNNINNIIESFDLVNESAGDVFKKIVEKAKEALAKIIDLVSKVFKKIIPKLYDAMQKLVTKLRGTSNIKVNGNKTVTYYTTTDLFDKYSKAIFDYSNIVDNHFSIIWNIYTYKDVTKEVQEAENSKEKLDELNQEIIKMAGITAISSTAEFEDKMITKTEMEIASDSDITNCINKLNTVMSDIKEMIAKVNALDEWLNKVKDQIDGLVKSESFKAFDNLMNDKSKTLVIGDESYGDTKLLQAIGLQEATRTSIRHFANLSHLLNVYMKKNIQSYKSICNIFKGNYSEDIVDTSLLNSSESEDD